MANPQRSFQTGTRPTGLGEMMMARMDRWSELYSWIPRPWETIPWRVFWKLFAWNFPVLFVALLVIGFLLYRSDSGSSNIGSFTGLPWLAELAIGAFALAFWVDFLGCLWLRRLWNRRARFLAAG